MSEQETVAVPEVALAIDNDAEDIIDKEIAALWLAQKDQAANARRTREELKAVRAQLSERLHMMKAMLVHTGRGGRWASYLREHRIPRATADRYVTRHESTLAPPSEKRLTEAFAAPALEDVHGLVKKLLPSLRRVLTTQEAAFEFCAELVVALPGIQGDVTDTGAVVFRPGEPAAHPMVQHGSRQALQVVA